MACPAPLSTASISVPPDRLLAMTPLCKGLVRATRPKWCTIRAWASAYATSSRPFNVLGIQQIAIGGLSKPALAALWVDEFGLRRIGNYRSEKENVDEDILSLGTGPWAVEVDLMQPIDPDKAPKVHVPPLNHIGLWVDDLPRAVESLTASGLRFAPGGIRRGASGYDITFLHPKSSEKVLVELVQAPSKEELQAKAEDIEASQPLDDTRPFRVMGLQQVAIGGLDKAALSALWVDIFGIPKIGDYRSERENVDEDILIVGTGKDVVEIDLMQPIDPEKSPKVHVPPLNHVGLWVDDIHAAVAHLQGRGVRFAPGGIRKGASGHDVTFIHPKGNEQYPKSGEGLLIELVQSPHA